MGHTSLIASRDQVTKRGGGVFQMDGKPMHWMDGGGSGLCVRCRTPIDRWDAVECFYPLTIAEAVDETAAMLEAVCATTVGLSVREACEQARVLRRVLEYGQ